MYNISKSLYLAIVVMDKRIENSWEVVTIRFIVNATQSKVKSGSEVGSGSGSESEQSYSIFW